ncbi:hypothetical protein [Acrocarpospora sp. B8E8]|uniref:hypothetical protein n=1 Tax=Acrocarpospora sp. B8E8 TaxID=3153572 RepID=UPI00325D7CCC
MRAEAGIAPDTGKPTLAWHFDQNAIDAEAADGWYALLSNLDPGQADAGQILRLYKGQEAIERRYSAFKGPLAVAACYLKNNRRIAALITVICLALLIFCLVKCQVQQALAIRDAHQGRGPVRRQACHPHRSSSSTHWSASGSSRVWASHRRSFLDHPIYRSASSIYSM